MAAFLPKPRSAEGGKVTCVNRTGGFLLLPNDRKSGILCVAANSSMSAGGFWHGFAVRWTISRGIVAEIGFELRQAGSSAAANEENEEARVFVERRDAYRTKTLGSRFSLKHIKEATNV
jgi:hypothetical protein